MIAGCWDLRPLSLAAHGSEARPPYLYSGDGNASFHEFTHQVLAYAPMLEQTGQKCSQMTPDVPLTSPTLCQELGFQRVALD